MSKRADVANMVILDTEAPPTHPLTGQPFYLWAAANKKKGSLKQWFWISGVSPSGGAQRSD